MSYRADIDGLRAIAVLSVLAFHYGAPFPWVLLPGGFTGVDVFFVISGFLITQILQGEIRAGTFSVLGFYDRRVRRILPALLVMLAAVLLAGRVLSLPGDYRAAAASSAAAAFGVSNFYFFGNTGYFDQTADLMPLLHTWSLAVEEQFYVVWPILLFAIAAGRARNTVAALVTALVVIGFVISIVWFRLDAKAAFFMALPRAWELALGALLVYLPPLPRKLGGTAVTLGLGLIALGFWRITPEAFPGWAALLPCAGAALVIWPREQETLAARFLGKLAPIGLISYSLYLWHWPVWVFFRVYINNGQPRIREAIVLTLISILLAALSWRFVERPFRRPAWPAPRTVGVGLGACTLLFCASGYVASSDGLPGRLPPEFLAMRSLDTMWDWPCDMIDVPPHLGKACVFGAPWTSAGKKVVLWGDSIAAMNATLLKQFAEERGVAVLDGRLTLDRRQIQGFDDFCRRRHEAILQQLAAEPAIKTVVLAASWDAQLLNLQASDQSALFLASLRTTIEALSKNERRVVIVNSPPKWSRDPLPCELIDAGLPRRRCSDADTTLERFDHAGTSQVVKALDSIAMEYPAVTIIDPGATLCQARCLTELNNEPLYRDAAHYRRNLSERTNRDLAGLIGLERIFD